MPTIDITKTAFKKMESEWYHYHNTLKEIARLREEIIHPFEEDPDDPSIVKGANSVRMPGSPTERMATRLATSKQLSYLTEIVNVIERVYNASPDNYKELIRIKYWNKNNKKTWVRIGEDLGISERQARRWRKEIIIAAIELIGWR